MGCGFVGHKARMIAVFAILVMTFVSSSADASERTVDIGLWSATFCRESASTRLLIDSGPNALSAGLATEVTDPASAALAKRR